jgi:hypothetical protein
VLEWFVPDTFVAQDLMYTYTSSGIKNGFHEIIERNDWYMQSEA